MAKSINLLRLINVAIKARITFPESQKINQHKHYDFLLILFFLISLVTSSRLNQILRDLWVRVKIVS